MLDRNSRTAVVFAWGRRNTNPELVVPNGINYNKMVIPDQSMLYINSALYTVNSMHG